MSLKWYKNAILDETQEAYGKTWGVDKIETDGTIVFRCGKETALAPRTDKPEDWVFDGNESTVDSTVSGSMTAYFPGVVMKQVDIALNTSPAVNCDLTFDLKSTDFQVTGEVVSYFPNGIDHNQRVVDFADSLEAEPELKQMVVNAMRLSPVEIAMRKRKADKK